MGPIRVERMVAGGLGLGHDDEGRVVLVEGGVPGDRVEVEVIEARPRLIRARLAQLLSPGGDRVTPPCPEVERGCGGCDLQHVESNAQLGAKLAIVVDSLNHIARVTDPVVRPGPRLSPFGYRTTLRCGVDPRTGRLGFRSRASHDIHAVDNCMIAHPIADDIISAARFPNATEVTVRVGARTGDRMVVVTGDPSGGTVPDGVTVVRAVDKPVGGRRAAPPRRPTDSEGDSRERRRAKGADSHGVDFHGSDSGNVDTFINEMVAGRIFRISADSFFQARPDGAEALIDSVRLALADFDLRSDDMVDLYGGVGLFSGGLGAHRAEVVEISPSAVADARVNLADLGARITRSSAERWRPRKASYVVADPARSGLGKAGVGVVDATGAHAVALVSCDPASMARDVRLLMGSGFELDWVEVIDMFPQTHHVETVAALKRRSSPR